MQNMYIANKINKFELAKLLSLLFMTHSLARARKELSVNIHEI